MHKLKTLVFRLWKHALFKVLVGLLAASIVGLGHHFDVPTLIALHWRSLLLFGGVAVAVTILTLFIKVDGELFRQTKEALGHVDKSLLDVSRAIGGAERPAIAIVLLEYVRKLQTSTLPTGVSSTDVVKVAEDLTRKIAKALAVVINYVLGTECEVCIKVMALPANAPRTEPGEYLFRRFAHSDEELLPLSWTPTDTSAPLKLLLGGRSHMVYGVARFAR